MEDMKLTTAQIIAVFETSRLQSETYSEKAVAAAYVEALAALHEKQEQESPEPLTPEQILQMRGKPVWCPEVNSWGIITFDKIGYWANRPFLRFFWLANEGDDCGVDCEYNIEERGLTLYRYKPPEKGGGTQ